MDSTTCGRPRGHRVPLKVQLCTNTSVTLEWCRHSVLSLLSLSGSCTNSWCKPTDTQKPQNFKECRNPGGLTFHRYIINYSSNNLWNKAGEVTLRCCVTSQQLHRYSANDREPRVESWAAVFCQCFVWFCTWFIPSTFLEFVSALLKLVQTYVSALFKLDQIKL